GHCYTETVYSPTCTTGGYSEYTCSECGDYYIGNYTNATGHCYTETYCCSESVNESGYTLYTCSGCGESWQDEDGKYLYTPELEFVKSDDGSSYIVKGFKDGTTVADVYIPANYEGLPVKEIADGAFYQTDINSVTIGKEITVIGESAFRECTSLTKVNIPASTITIGEYAFANCTALEVIYYEATKLENFELYTFRNAGKESATNELILYISSNVEIIPISLFSASKNIYIFITAVIFEKDSICTTIKGNAFQYLTYLEYIVLPSSVKSIGLSAFGSCSALKAIYYYGTETQWDSITISSSNSAINSSQIYYYSSDYAENCWHYENGLPELW
ncbi:MAG: leucine-rich repeat domain-containing protein, partial [Clostridia bacterium]|nr:leucine-rich repeat domain-containing protein [Clostridia bacterium]